MESGINIDRKLLAKLGIDVDKVLGPGIKLSEFSLSTRDGLILKLEGRADAPHAELVELRAEQLVTRLSAALDELEDGDKPPFRLETKLERTINDREVDSPEDD